MLVSSMWGNNIKISIFGESHGPAVGVVIDGFPYGQKINFEYLKFQMKKRLPPGVDITSRKEQDDLQILSGVLNGVTTGTPICAIIKNEDIESQNYDIQRFFLRPGHADYTNYVKYKGFEDFRGGGHSSGRLTAALVFAGTICREFLLKNSINVISHIYSVGNIEDVKFNSCSIDDCIIKKLSKDFFPVIEDEKGIEMKNKISDLKSKGDSIGGIIECAVIGVPAGIGDPIFDNVESKISSIIFGIPGIKGIEFGSGFSGTKLEGSINNDCFLFGDKGICTSTNNHGGVLGGISSGMPIIFKAAFKPTPSIKKVQNTVNLKSQVNCQISVQGRHDPCIAVRAPVIVESAAAIAILDLMVPYLNK